MIDKEETYWVEEYKGYEMSIQLTQKGRWHAFCYPKEQKAGTAAHVSAEKKEEITPLAKGEVERLLAKRKEASSEY